MRKKAAAAARHHLPLAALPAGQARARRRRRRVSCAMSVARSHPPTAPHATPVRVTFLGALGRKTSALPRCTSHVSRRPDSRRLRSSIPADRTALALHMVPRRDAPSERRPDAGGADDRRRDHRHPRHGRGLHVHASSSARRGRARCPRVRRAQAPKQEQFHLEHDEYLPTGADDTDFFPTADPGREPQLTIVDSAVPPDPAGPSIPGRRGRPSRSTPARRRSTAATSRSPAPPATPPTSAPSPAPHRSASAAPRCRCPAATGST